MEFLGQLLAKIIYYLLKLFGNDIAKSKEADKVVREEGQRAETAANDAVSELQTPEGSKVPNPEEVPSVQKWADYFKHRRNRKRP